MEGWYESRRKKPNGANTELKNKINCYVKRIEEAKKLPLTDMESRICLTISFLKDMFGENLNEGVLLSLLPDVENLLFRHDLKISEEQDNIGLNSVDSRDSFFVKALNDCSYCGGLFIGGERSEKGIFISSLYPCLCIQTYCKGYSRGGRKDIITDQIYSDDGLVTEQETNEYTDNIKSKAVNYSCDYDYKDLLVYYSGDGVSNKGIQPVALERADLPYIYWGDDRSHVVAAQFDRYVACLPNMKAKFDKVFGGTPRKR